MITRVRLAFIAAFVAVGVGGSSASATWDPDIPGTPRAAADSQLLLTATGPGGGVTGSIGPVGSVADPAVAYPPSTAGFTPLIEPFAGIITAEPPTGPPPTLEMYCINIRTPTGIGYGYDLGTWGAANVNNVGYVARVLNSYYPTVPGQPAGLGSASEQAAAVQAAIWYFADNYVLDADDPLADAVTTIVNTVRSLGPLPPPVAPALTITPPATTIGPIGSPIGPFVIVTDDPAGAIVSATDTDMSSDQAGTTPVADGTTVPTGTTIYLRSETSGPATLQAEVTAQVPGGNVYLYTGNIVGVDQAQKLVLARTATVTTDASADATFQQPTTTTTTSTSTTTTSTSTTTTAPPTSTSLATSTSAAPSSSALTTTTTSTTVPATTTTVPARTTTTSRPSGRLPTTGSDTGHVLLLATGLGVVGMSIVLVVRRKPPASE